jgi:glutathione S-transferase
MRLYHHPISFNARRAVMTALELGTEVELVHVELAKGAQKAPAFLKMNVSGKVPVLDDDGFYLSESHAIMQYLAEKSPGQTLYPEDLRRRAEVNRWLFWSAHHLSPSVGIINWERNVKRFLGQGEPEPSVVARGETLFGEAMTALDAHLAGKPWLAGETMTLADVAVATPFMTMGSAKLPVSDRPNVLGWLEKMTARDSWKKTAL